MRPATCRQPTNHSETLDLLDLTPHRHGYRVTSRSTTLCFDWCTRRRVNTCGSVPSSTTRSSVWWDPSRDPMPGRRSSEWDLASDTGTVVLFPSSWAHPNEAAYVKFVKLIWWDVCCLNIQILTKNICLLTTKCWMLFVVAMSQLHVSPSTGHSKFNKIQCRIHCRSD